MTTTAPSVATALPPPTGLSLRLPRLNLAALRPRFQLLAPEHGDRGALEDYIRGRFRDAHAARIQQFLPILLSLKSERAWCAAVGLAPASSQPWFAETYLDAPVEVCVHRQCGVLPKRDEILEIGNLVSTWKGSSLLLFVLLSELIVALGYRWVLFTATQEVQKLLAKLSYQPWVLASADQSRLGANAACWGRYYEHAPKVMFGEVAPAVAVARKHGLYRLMARALMPSVSELAQQFREACATRAGAESQGSQANIGMAPAA